MYLFVCPNDCIFPHVVSFVGRIIQKNLLNRMLLPVQPTRPALIRRSIPVLLVFQLRPAT